jgi:hypothetical protein
VHVFGNENDGFRTYCRPCGRDGDPEATGFAVRIFGFVYASGSEVTYYDTLELAQATYNTATTVESWDDGRHEVRLVEYVDGSEVIHDEANDRTQAERQVEAMEAIGKPNKCQWPCYVKLSQW